MKNTVVIIVFDESGSDNTNGGGLVYWTVVGGPKVKLAHKSTTLYQHESTLRETMELLGLVPTLGSAATAADMGEFFN